MLQHHRVYGPRKFDFLDKTVTRFRVQPDQVRFFHEQRSRPVEDVARYAELADIVCGEPVVGSDEAKSAALIAALRTLIDDVALPATLAEAKVKQTDLEMLAKDAMLQQRLLVNNPRDVAYDDALGIYRAAYGSPA